jgi:hypothetical protein
MLSVYFQHYKQITYLTFSLTFFLQLRKPAIALSRKFLPGLTTAGHFNEFFVICIIRIFTKKIENLKLRGNNSVCAGPFQLLCGRAPAQLRGNITRTSTIILHTVLHGNSISVSHSGSTQFESQPRRVYSDYSSP